MTRKENEINLFYIREKKIYYIFFLYIRETGVHRHNWGPIRLCSDVRGFQRGTLSWVPHDAERR